MSNNNRVVITGVGNISALGNTWEEISKALKGARSAIRYMDDWDQYPDLKTRLAAPVSDFNLPESYRAKKKRSMGRVAQMAVRATELAIEDAGLMNNEKIKDGSTGVAYGSATGSSAAALEFFSLLENQAMDRINTTTYIRMMSHTAAVNIGVYFGTTGRMYTTSSACTAGSQGVGYAYEAIRSGQQSIMIAGGAEELCPTQAAVFDTIYAASTSNETPERSPRPFDLERDGLVLGEGACSLILENYEHAKARGAEVLAEIIGYGTNTDGSHTIRPKQETMVKVMELCLQDAGIDPSTIGYVSAHATATEHGDILESTATMEVLGEKPISSLKSFTGHSLGACGAFELWASIMMMREGWFAPTLNLSEVDSRCAPLDYIQDSCRSIQTDTILSNNFAFGGINTSILAKLI